MTGEKKKHHVVMFSGGLGSWAAARRVRDRHGPENMTLLFADTKMEDQTLYEFLDAAAQDIGARLEIIADGRNPWEVFADEKFIGNSRVDPCSKILKRKLMDKWVKDRFQPDEVVCYVGIDWSEEHRIEKLKPRKLPYIYEAPLCDDPPPTKEQIKWMARDAGIPIPRLYSLGFPHNNCGGFCVKAGHAQFKLLLEVMPERYAYHEQKEQELREIVGDHTILKITVGGEKIPITLKEFRERIERGDTGQIDLFAWGGCACAIE